ncbi:MAG: hypothetical protein HY319_23285 [Armatimonadetes bacterium]|nr:hypothetical protein [Armatimonadota bacterium]
MLISGQSQTPPFSRTTVADGQQKQLRVREPQRFDLGDVRIREVRDEILDTVLNVATALVPQDQSPQLDRCQDPGDVWVDSVHLWNGGASTAQTTSEARDGEARIKFSACRPGDPPGSSPGPDLWLVEAGVVLRDGTRYLFSHGPSSLDLSRIGPDAVETRIKIKSSGSMEWLVHDPAQFGKSWKD